jgi:hypothetical protein
MIVKWLLSSLIFLRPPQGAVLRSQLVEYAIPIAQIP